MPRTRRQESKDLKMASSAIVMASSVNREQKTKMIPAQRKRKQRAAFFFSLNLSMMVAKKTLKAAERTLMRMPRLLANFSDMW